MNQSILKSQSCSGRQPFSPLWTVHPISALITDSFLLSTLPGLLLHPYSAALCQTHGSETFNAASKSLKMDPGSYFSYNQHDPTPHSTGQPSELREYRS